MYTLGIDVSHWQGTMDFAKAKSAGAEFAFLRAGSINYVTGIPYTDYQFERNSEEALKHFDHVGYYWFWRANQDPIVQADYFCDLIKWKTWDLAPVADIEASNGVDPAILTTKAKKFIDRIEANLNVKPIIYTRASFWNIATTKPSWSLAYDLWVARYIALTHPWGDGKFIPYPWGPALNGWEYWQFSADGNGRGAEFGADSADIDLNYKRIPFTTTPPPTPNTVEISKEVAEAMYQELKSALGH